VRRIVEIGRDNPGRFNLNNFISREHLRIERKSDKIIFTDLNSRNGTKVILSENSGQMKPIGRDLWMKMLIPVL
jgi:hypothetical protein